MTAIVWVSSDYYIRAEEPTVLAFRLFSAFKICHRLPPSNYCHQIACGSANKICSAKMNAAIATGHSSLIIGFTSDDAQMRRSSVVRWMVHFALCLAALPPSFVPTAVPPCMLLVYLALLCALQVILTTTETVEERRVESEDLELVAEL